jgi:hypothetical protein
MKVNCRFYVAEDGKPGRCCEPNYPSTDCVLDREEKRANICLLQED